jgi:hypothetical protein
MNPRLSRHGSAYLPLSRRSEGLGEGAWKSSKFERVRSVQSTISIACDEYTNDLVTLRVHRMNQIMADRMSENISVYEHRHTPQIGSTTHWAKVRHTGSNDDTFMCSQCVPPFRESTITPSVSHKYSRPERPLCLLIVATDVKSSGYRVMVTQSSSMLHYSPSYIIF